MENGKYIGKVSEKQQGSAHSGQGTGNRGNRPASGAGHEGKGFHRRILSEEEGKNIGGKGNVEVSAILRADVRADAKTQQDRLVEWAREKGCLYDENDHEALKSFWLKDENNLPEKIGGMEAEVYPCKNNQCVVKVTNYAVFSRKPLYFLNNRITYHNMVFPDSAYKLLGIMNYRDSRGNDIFRFVTEQPFIQGEKPTCEEIENELNILGFKKDKYAKNVYVKEYDDKYLRLSDAHTGNLIKDKTGKVFCIDSVFETANH